jgi:hypothetical protein
MNRDAKTTTHAISGSRGTRTPMNCWWPRGHIDRSSRTDAAVLLLLVEDAVRVPRPVHLDPSAQLPVGQLPQFGYRLILAALTPGKVNWRTPSQATGEDSCDTSNR